VIKWRRLAKPELTYDFGGGLLITNSSSTLQETAAVATIITRRKQEKNSLNGGGGEIPRKNNQLSLQTQISTTKTSAVGTLLSYENPSPQHEI
jgi:hypothetical protein